MAEKNKQTKKFMDDEAKNRLQDTISSNLIKLKNAMGWNQKSFARETGIPEATLSNYMKGGDILESRLPSFDYLVSLTQNQAFKNNGIKVSLDLLISDQFDPANESNKLGKSVAELQGHNLHKDFVGNYLCYFFEQSKPKNNQDLRSGRELRYGVISAYEDRETLTGNVLIKAYAVFFKGDEKSLALELKARLDGAFASKEKSTVKDRNAAILKAFDDVADRIYVGDVTFGEEHMFITVNGTSHVDHAMIILHSPPKRTASEYIGGIGTVASVTRGRSHMPVAQKIILSKFELNCSDEVISEHLSMSFATIEQRAESEAICALSCKLYSDPSFSESLDEDDKRVIIQRRLDQLVRNYVDKNICSVGSVSEDEDKAMYELIDISRS